MKKSELEIGEVFCWNNIGVPDPLDVGGRNGSDLNIALTDGGFKVGDEVVLISEKRFAQLTTDEIQGVWTKEAPVEAGWYWWRENELAEMEAVRVELSMVGLSCFDADDFEREFTSVTRMGGEWWSIPIPLPVPGK